MGHVCELESKQNERFNTFQDDHAQRLATEMRTRSAHDASVAERLAYVEKVLDLGSERHKVDQLFSRLHICEDHCASNNKFNDTMAKHGSDVATLHAQIASAMERLSYAEQSLCALGEDHNRKIA